jgi:endonuclease-3
VEELREDRSAPVDTDGSEALPETDKGEKVYRFQVLVALMLSSQTKDAVVGQAMRDLQQHGLTVENLRKTSPEDLNKLIYRVGFHNNKTKYLKQVVEILHEQYDHDIPPTAEQMMLLPGVGPKMAYIVENVVFGLQSGIGIDTHMHRIFNQLKWVQATKNPEKTRLQLEAWLPKEYWASVNLLWVGFGQEVQQFQPKLLRKALDSSRPKEALKLVKRLGLDYNKEGAKLGCVDEIQACLKGTKE